jgi:branched-chain amino acid transport system substrate-binding protein
MKRKILIPLAIPVVIIAAIAIYFTQKPKEPETIKIGAILPLTGNASLIGEWVKNGIDLAVEEVNSSGGVNGKKIEIIYGDSKNDPKEGISVFNQIFSIYKLPVIISAMTGVTNSLIPLADKNRIVLFATTVSAPGVADKSPWVFRLFITADIDAKTMAEFALNKLKIKKLGVIYVNDEMGLSFSKIFSTTIEKGGATIIFNEAFDKGLSDFRNLALKIKKFDVEAIYIVGYENNLGVLPKQLREMNINARFLSIGTISQPNVFSQAGKFLDGTYFTTVEFTSAAPKTEVAKKFVNFYKIKYGKEPNYFSAFSYDTIMLIVTAIKRSGYNAQKIQKELLNIKDFDGVCGKITIKSNGDAEFPMVVKTIKNGRIEDVR